MSARRPRVVARKPIYEGWSRFEIVTVEAPDSNGEVRRIEREVIDHGDASAVLVIDRDRDVAIMVRQWRAPLLLGDGEPALLEACAGLIDPGESPEEAARREAEEEIGLRVREMRSLGSIFPSAGTLTERIHLFVAEVSARDRIANGGGGNPHENEDIEVIEAPLGSLFEMARRGEIEDAKTLAIVQKLLIEALDSRPR
jgi:nudix-type nucleoside diphosphatase (YffH/AdpP family)